MKRRSFLQFLGMAPAAAVAAHVAAKAPAVAEAAPPEFAPVVTKVMHPYGDGIEVMSCVSYAYVAWRPESRFISHE